MGAALNLRELRAGLFRRTVCVVAMLTDGWYLSLKGRGGGEVIVVVKGKETMTSSGGSD